MTRLDLNLDELLDDRFSIEVKDYWLLPVSDKELITNIVLKMLSPRIKRHKDYMNFYFSLFIF